MTKTAKLTLGPLFFHWSPEKRRERVMKMIDAVGMTVKLDRLQLGDIVLRDVRALVAPGLHGNQVLLGMSALNKLEFTQRGGTMLLRQTTN